MIIKCNPINDFVIQSSKLIDIFEAEKDLVKVDKYGYEYIDCTQLPEKYDNDTAFTGKIVSQWVPKLVRH